MAYNGKIQSLLRHYNSLRKFVGENRVYPAGDVLMVSTQNNEDYDVVLFADGVSTFKTLYANRKKVSGDVPPNSVGSEEIIDNSIRKKDLSDEVREGLDELNNISLTDEDIEKWFDDDPTNDDPEE